MNAAAGDFRLAYGSPCIDAGTNLSALITTDLDGNPRPLDGNGDGIAAFDMGAYEYPETADSNADGIPDWWCNLLRSGPGQPGMGDENPDHDCQTTFEEWLADTDPTNDQSYLRINHIEFSPNGATATVYFLGSISRYYTLFCAAAIDGPRTAWTSLPEQTAIRGSGGMDRLTDTHATMQTFYKVGVDVRPPYYQNMVWIPPGTFLMGSPTNEVDRWHDEGPQTRVTLSRGFYVGKYEVTQGEYLRVMGSNPSWFSTNSGDAEDLSRPVEVVTWFDATNYCGLLTERERAAGRLLEGYVYRLPTEAEWEYACRAGTTTRFSYGDDPGYTKLTDYAWLWDNGDDRTHPVGQKLANPRGLHDMHGNVWEWCADWYGTYPGSSVTDPQGPDTGSVRVIRGGGCSSKPDYCRSAARSNYYPDYGGSDAGFRVVLAPGQ